MNVHNPDIMKSEKKYIHGFLYLCLFLSQKNDFEELNNFNLFLYLSSAIFIFLLLLFQPADIFTCRLLFLLL